ncbi:MAG TPA: DNA translocase FtsK [Candidatus Avoscillospira stercorigallinarum]|uniref:DNA translocase FtsK n=1 Tax=Candidatus Avoscillospira stercorigallinarum TaxID=2840708 RepID=A0A9D1CPZ2_9FIRM|nr:DNA translocase FtsK [Candidatus Avoscillospira stercorigallinarum]
MAERKKTTGGGRSTGKSTARGRAGAKSAVRPIRREVWAFVCLFLAALLLLGLFGIQAFLISPLVDLVRGLIGSGIFVLPFSLLAAFLILLFHDGRPVRLRVSCALGVSLGVGILGHLFAATAEIEWGFPMVVELWKTGVEHTSGGVIAGFLAMLLRDCISLAGATVLTVILMVVALLFTFRLTIPGLFRAYRERPRPEYEPPQREHADPAKVLVDHVASRQIQKTERRRSAIADFDIPVDEPVLPPPPKETAKKKKKADKFLESLERLEELDQPVQTQIPDTAPVVETPLVVPKAKTPEPEPVPAPEPPPVSPQKAKFDAAAAALPDLMLPDDPTRKAKKDETRLEAAKIASEIAQAEEQPAVYAFPPVRLLQEASGAAVDGTEEMQLNAQRLSDTLVSFGIDAHIINVIRGPSVTRYELELDRGVKLSKLTNLADDIALALGATGVRISAIPDKISIVGIEVPNKLVSTVHIRDVIDSVEFHKSKSRISFAVGKDIGGNCIIGDIAKLPHLLIAGTTGSGKSVCMNSLIISLLFKAKPEEVRLIMVDPKMVELGIYNGIPHLLIPVVTDPKKAAGALQWAVTEMMKRYRMMADAGVRDLDSYNKTCATVEDRQTLPQIVVVIDELADLMLVAAKEVEEAICRVAQMGRASGIHLVIATQRPSADVITGLMKANIPSRIAFAVASAMESRIILDTAGAEKLVGKGDMLYAPLGQGKPRRVQGCFITDDEVQSVVEFIKGNAAADYDDAVMQEIDQKAKESGSKSGSGGASAASLDEGDSEGDELLPAAVDVILETGQASVSMLQRRLKLGYARAARIVDEMEEKGIVGPFEGSKPRQLLITKEQWQQMQGLAPEPPAEEEPVPEDLPWEE